MKILFDTNIILDVMLDRLPFSTEAAKLCSKVETGELTGFLGATTVTTIHYLAAKVVGTGQARMEIEKLLRLFEIAPVNRVVLESALVLRFADFEDAVLHEAAICVGALGIVTRDVAGFQHAALPVYSPVELLSILNSS